MDPTAATPETAPAPQTIDDVVGLLEREQQQAGTESTPEPKTAATPDPEPDTETAEAQEDDGQDPDQPKEAPPTYRVKVRGEEQEVTLDELLKGYSRTEDYKAKTAEVARERETTLAERQRYATALQDSLQTVEQMDPVLASWRGIKDHAQFARDNPAEYVALKAQAEQRFGHLNAMRQQAITLQAEQRQQFLADQAEKLAEKLPEWNDVPKRKEMSTKVTKTLSDLGFSPQEIEGVLDHRIVLGALEVARYRELMEAKKTAESKRVVDTPKVQTPGAPQPRNAPTSQRAAALKRQALATNNSVEKAELVAKYLELKG